MMKSEEGVLLLGVCMLKEQGLENVLNMRALDIH